MDYKSMTKTGLVDFITSKVNAQKKEVNDQISLMINSKIEPLIAVYVDVKKVENMAEKFAELFQGAIEKYQGFIDEWEYKRIVENINRRGVPFGSNITEKMKNKIFEYVQFPENKAIKMPTEELTTTVAELQKEAKPLYEKLLNLKKLQNEIERVIKMETNGSKGYKALVALGVDMSGYEGSNSNLPAVVKLSVDVCLLNGNCDEKSA